MPQKLPSKKMLQAEARDCIFDPRAVGPMKIIADTDNLDYFKGRAIECINRSQIENPKKELQMAVGLLLLALAKVKNGEHKSQG